MPRASNTRRHFLSAHDTAALAQDGCRIIEALAHTHGFNVEIADLQQQVLNGLMSHPLWQNTGPDAWVNWPDSCLDSITGKHSGLWAIIRRTFPSYNWEEGDPRRAVVWVPDRTGRPTSKWMVIDDPVLMRETFDLTFDDSRSRFDNDVEAAAQIFGVNHDAVAVALTEGLNAMWVMGRSILDISIRFTDDINLKTPAEVKARFGWQSHRDAINAFQVACHAANVGTIAVGETLWDMYVDKLAVGGLVP